MTATAVSHIGKVSSFFTASENFALLTLIAPFSSIFYKSCIQSVLICSFMCWFGNICQKDKNNLQGIANFSTKINGLKQSILRDLYDGCLHIMPHKYVFYFILKSLKYSKVKTLSWRERRPCPVCRSHRSRSPRRELTCVMRAHACCPACRSNSTSTNTKF